MLYASCLCLCTCPCHECPCQYGTKNHESSSISHLSRRQNQDRIEGLIPASFKQTLSTRDVQQWTNPSHLHPSPKKSSLSRKCGQSRSASTCGLFCPIRSPSPLGLHFRGSSQLTRAPVVCPHSHSLSPFPLPGPCPGCHPASDIVVETLFLL